MLDFKSKKCPFNNKATAGLGARAFTECCETGCRFQGINGNRCAILEMYEMLKSLTERLNGIPSTFR